MNILTPGEGTMNEPVSSTTVSVGLGTTTLMSYWAGIPSTVIIGSFAGAVVYVLTNSDIPIIKRLTFFLISFLVGIMGADYSSKIIEAVTTGITRNHIVVDSSIGALVASAVAIKLLMKIIGKVSASDLTPGGPSS